MRQGFETSDLLVDGAAVVVWKLMEKNPRQLWNIKFQLHFTCGCRTWVEHKNILFRIEYQNIYVFLLVVGSAPQLFYLEMTIKLWNMHIFKTYNLLVVVRVVVVALRGYRFSRKHNFIVILTYSSLVQQLKNLLKKWNLSQFLSLCFLHVTWGCSCKIEINLVVNSETR